MKNLTCNDWYISKLHKEFNMRLSQSISGLDEYNKLSPGMKKAINKRIGSIENQETYFIHGLSFCCFFLIFFKNDFIYVKSYDGRKTKPSNFYKFGKVAACIDFIDRKLSLYERHYKEQLSNKKTLQEIKQGDVLYASFGYEQTNVSYYLVLERTGKASVSLVEIEAEKTFNGSSMSGTCKPNINNHIGKPFTKRISGSEIKINSSIRLSLLDSETVNGQRVFKESQFSSYG